MQMLQDTSYCMFHHHLTISKPSPKPTNDRTTHPTSQEHIGKKGREPDPDQCPAPKLLSPQMCTFIEVAQGTPGFANSSAAWESRDDPESVADHSHTFARRPV